jgi:4-hydroxy-tetrahydrodipicolinate synthase
VGQPFVSGIIVATVTPYRGSTVDQEAFRELISKLEERGVHGFYVAGTVGESLYLRIEERVKLYEAALDVRKKAKVLASVMSTTVDEALEYARKVRDLGVDAIFATPPLYYKPSRLRLVDYYVRLADASDKPVIIYTIPSNVGYNVPVDVVREAALQHSGIVGIKATVDDLHYLHDLVSEVKAVRPDFTVLTGYGEYMLDALVVGGDGAVDAISNLVPKLTASIYEAWRAGKLDEAIKLHRAMARLSVAVRRGGPLPQLLKSLLRLLGLGIEPTTRVPDGVVDPQMVNLLHQLLCTSFRAYLVEDKGCKEVE